MLLVKKGQFFHYFVWLKIRLEIRLNNVLDTKEPFFDCARKISKSPKKKFSKGVNPCFWSKNAKFFFIWIWSK